MAGKLFGSQPQGGLQVGFLDRSAMSSVSSNDSDFSQEAREAPGGSYWFLPTLGQQGPESKGDAEDSDYEESENDQFVLVGCEMRNGSQEDHSAAELVVRSGPIVTRSEFSRIASLGIEFAREVARDLVSGSESAENPIQVDSSESKEREIFVKVGSRTVDVQASLRHSFGRLQDSEGQVPRKALRDLISSLDLHLDDDEYAEAIEAFPGASFSFETFQTWWLG